MGLVAGVVWHSPSRAMLHTGALSSAGTITLQKGIGEPGKVH